MDWLPRAFAILVVLMLGILAVDFIGVNATLEKECWSCAYERRHGEPPMIHWCTSPGNMHCPTCDRSWQGEELSWTWVPWDSWRVIPFFLLLAGAPAFLSAARVARCPDCEGRLFIRRLHETEVIAPCLRCGGRGRVTLLNRWYVLRRRPPLSG